MPYLHLDHLRVHYQHVGEGPRTVVFVHGNFATWRWWRPILDRLPRGFCGYAPDSRGCGESTGAFGSFSIPQLAGDLDAFANALELDRFHLVGHSLGGATALQYALDHPERIISLSLLAPAPASGMTGMRQGHSRSARHFRRTPRGNGPAAPFMQLAYGLSGMFGYKRALLRRTLGALIPPEAIDDQTFAELVADAARVSPHTVLGYFRALERWNVMERLAECSTPTRILWGEQDAIVPVDPLVETASGLPRGRLVVWPGVGHSPQFEAPDRLARWLFRFMAGSSLALRTRMLFWRPHKTALCRAG